MTRLLLALFVMSCGQRSQSKTEKEAEHPPQGGSGSGSGSGSSAPNTKASPRTLQLADVPLAPGTPFELHDLKVMQAAYVRDGNLSESGDLELRAVVKPTGPVDPDARLSIVTTCRTHDVNLTFDEDRDKTRQNIAEAIAKRGGEIAAIYHADPFTEFSSPCEHTVRYRADKAAAPITVASLCYKDAALAVGPCPPGTFPPPAADQGDLGLSSPVLAAFKAGSVGITGMFTLGKALAPNETLGSTWRCSDGKATSSSKPQSDSVVFWTPSAMPAGTSAKGGLTSFLDGDAGAPVRCELTVAARANKKARTLGTFCIDNAGAVVRGACVPKL